MNDVQTEFYHTIIIRTRILIRHRETSRPIYGIVLYKYRKCKMIRVDDGRNCVCIFLHERVFIEIF